MPRSKKKEAKRRANGRGKGSAKGGKGGHGGAISRTDTVAEVLTACKNAEDFNAEQCSHAIHTMAIRGAREWGCRDVLDASEVWAKLLKRSEAVARDFNMMHTSKSLWGLAKLGCSVLPPLLQALEQAIIRTVDDMDARGISNVLWAYASMQVTPIPAVSQCLSRRAMESDGSFNARDVSNALWASAKLPGLLLDNAIEALHARTERVVDTAVAQEIANMLWSASTQSAPAPPKTMLEALHLAAVAKAEDMSAQHVSNVRASLS